MALELCVQFRDRLVVRRARVSGSWGVAEQAVPFFPFIREQPFKVLPSVTSQPPAGWLQLIIFVYVMLTVMLTALIFFHTGVGGLEPERDI